MRKGRESPTLDEEEVDTKLSVNAADPLLAMPFNATDYGEDVRFGDV